MLPIRSRLAAVVFRFAVALCLILPGTALRAEETATAVELYNAGMKQYFVTASAAELAAIEAGAAGPGWSRTGLSFKVWDSAAGAAGLSPVCRFAGVPVNGSSGHFYTADPNECEAVKHAAGWIYEGTAFYVRRPSAGTAAGIVNRCASTDVPIMRLYNNGYPQAAAGHRYTSDGAIYAGMLAQNWLGEGVAFCARGETVNHSEYLTFSLNTQDYAYPELSIAMLRKVVETHERHQIPVDVYLTTTMIDLYEQMAPDLLDKLRTSPWVALSYHTRPPKPYHYGYDWSGIGETSYAQQYATIMNYETHGLDLVTGLPTAAAGGFGKLKSLLGAAPVLTAFLADKEVESAVSDVFRDMGAKMRIVHGRIVNAGEKQRDLYIRPEHVDMILLEHASENIGSALDAALQEAHAAAGASAPYFVGVKMHDNDFFADHSAWTETYQRHGKRPPWDLSYKSPLLDATTQALRWSMYESAVAYASANRARVGALNGPGLLALVSAPASVPQPQPATAAPTIYVSGNMHIETNQSLWPNVDNLIAFFRRVVAIGKVGSQSTSMRWSLGPDIGWLQNEPRARDTLQTLVELGVELDVHAHNTNDQAKIAEILHNWGFDVTQVLNGVRIVEVDGARTAQTSPTGYQWQAKYLWGFNRDTGHAIGVDDHAIGLWRPKSSAEYTVHDPNGNLISIGNGDGTLSTIESFASQLGSAYTAPVYSASVNIKPWVLQVAGSGENIDGLAAFAERAGALPNLRWATNREIAEAWIAAGSVASRVDLPDQ